jgi:hypothetical protein
MTIEEALQKAQKSGYVTGFMYDNLAAIDPLGAFEIILLDPNFWKVLGESIGWKSSTWVCFNCGEIEGSEVTFEEECEHCGADVGSEAQWLIEWHRFIDHLAEGKTISEFFKQL